MILSSALSSTLTNRKCFCMETNAQIIFQANSPKRLDLMKYFHSLMLRSSKQKAMKVVERMAKLSLSGPDDITAVSIMCQWSSLSVSALMELMEAFENYQTLDVKPSGYQHRLGRGEKMTMTNVLFKRLGKGSEQYFVNCLRMVLSKNRMWFWLEWRSWSKKSALTLSGIWCNLQSCSMPPCWFSPMKMIISRFFLTCEVRIYPWLIVSKSFLSCLVRKFFFYPSVNTLHSQHSWVHQTSSLEYCKWSRNPVDPDWFREFWQDEIVKLKKKSG